MGMARIERWIENDNAVAAGYMSEDGKASYGHRLTVMLTRARTHGVANATAACERRRYEKTDDE